MRLMRGGSERISPTAHYTGQVWVRHGLADPAFATPEGRAFFHALRPANQALGLLGKPTLDSYLLARHELIDHLLTDAIERQGITQVIEVAAGLSPRGWRFTRRFGELTYVEADLPGMAERKRRLLDRVGLPAEGHRVAEVDVLVDDGPRSIAALAEDLDPDRGLVIITEGLLNYLDRAAVTGVWSRFAAVLGGFRTGRYLSDLHLRRQEPRLLAGLAATALSAFVRGQVHLHFADVAEATDELHRAGFGDAVLHSPASYVNTLEHCGAPGARLVRVVDAAT